ncbi:uncharacterized protein LOC131682552 isoform X2 [Topomyia yanbarensis]|uniref:uncharacterized protein LOC131682552 isoform X2 n=1 Tax=Topomyia yanbarensis TaxID=2498891 RepID=UPI00273B1691|nr:uncharacterized protein LOC131682552 isoform X2 [Topomyia yanbarensis]
MVLIEPNGYIYIMYIDLDLLSLQRNGCLAAVWLAATNKTLFRRHFKRGQCDRIDIDDLCKSILACANTHSPLVLVAKLAYGVTYIYQQQVQFLYDRVSSAACNQSIAFQALRKQKLSHKTTKCIVQGEITFEDVLGDAALSTEAVISQLLAGEQQTSVKCVDDITMQEITTFSGTDKTFEVENGFGEIQLNDDSQFIDMLPTSSSLKDTRNDSGIVEDSLDIVESQLDSQSPIVDQTLREVSVPESELENPSMAILNMPIASTSVVRLYQQHDSDTVNHSREADQYVEEIPLSAIPIPFSEEIEDSHLNIIPLTTTRKRKLNGLIIDNKNKLDADTMKRAIKESYKTQRCTDPRVDVMPIQRIRYPFDQASIIFQHPVRNTRSSLLPYLFTRNTRKRSSPIEDILDQSWIEELEISKKTRTEKETLSDDTLQSLELLRLPHEQALPLEIIAQSGEITQDVTAVPGPVHEHIVDPINVCPKIDSFDEESVLKLLPYLWNNNQHGVTFKSLEKYFSNRLDAASCFATVLALIAKQKLVVSTTERNEIFEINRGPNS